MMWYNPNCGLNEGGEVVPCASETYVSPFLVGSGQDALECQLAYRLFPVQESLCYWWSPSFQVISLPTTLLQVQAIPYAVVYQPPGDFSTQQFQKTSTYITQLSAGTTNTAQSGTASNYVEGIAYSSGTPSSFSKWRPNPAAEFHL